MIKVRKKLEIKEKKQRSLTRNPCFSCIEATRFELAASASRTQRSTKLSHASKNKAPTPWPDVHRTSAQCASGDSNPEHPD